MDNELLAYMLQLIQSMSWPDEPTITPESRQLYESATDTLMMYHGDPRLLFEALHMFAETGSQPYAYAGIAHTLLCCSYEQAHDYDRAGLREAAQWLRRAQQSVSDCIEINVLDAKRYLLENNLKSTRLVLDYFQKHQHEHVYICFVEMSYWNRLGRLDEVQRWFRRANVLSQEPIHRLYALTSLANCYQANDRLDDCIQAYNLATTLFPHDPWVWHNLSIAYIDVRNYKDAIRCNQKALSIMQFPAAEAVEKALLKNMGRLPL